MGEKKLLYIFIFILVLGLGAFQNCSGQFVASGNGDPHEGIDTGIDNEPGDRPVDMEPGGPMAPPPVQGQKPPPIGDDGDSENYVCKEGATDYFQYLGLKKDQATSSWKIIIWAKDGDQKEYDWDFASVVSIYDPVSNTIIVNQILINKEERTIVLEILDGDEPVNISTTCQAI